MMETTFSFLQHCDTLPDGNLTDKAEKEALKLGSQAKDKQWRPLVFASPLLGAKRTAALFIMGHGPYEGKVDSGPLGSFTLDSLQMETRGELVSLQTSFENSPIEFREPPPALMAASENQSEELLALIKTDTFVFAFALKRAELVVELVQALIKGAPGEQILLVSHSILIELALLLLHNPEDQPEKLLEHPFRLLAPGESFEVTFDSDSKVALKSNF